jgi:hypothetical protein
MPNEDRFGFGDREEVHESFLDSLSEPIDPKPTARGKEDAEPKKKESKKKEPRTVDLDAEVAGAVFAAATNGTGYMNTTGSHHATKVDHLVVRVEIPPGEGKDRQHLIVEVPQTVTFTLREE